MTRRFLHDHASSGFSELLQAVLRQRAVPFPGQRSAAISPLGWVAIVAAAAACSCGGCTATSRPSSRSSALSAGLISAGLAFALVLVFSGDASQRQGHSAPSASRSSMSSSDARCSSLIGLGLAVLCAQPIRGPDLLSRRLLPAADDHADRHRLHVPNARRHDQGAVRAGWQWVASAISPGRATPGRRALFIVIGDSWQWIPFIFVVLLAALENVAA